MERTGRFCAARCVTPQNRYSENGGLQLLNVPAVVRRALSLHRTNEVEWSGEEALTTYTSSDWAERGFCSVCGSSLFYRVTKDGPFHGAMHIAFGTLDDQSGFDMKMEFYIDLKPSAYAFAGEHKRLTEAEVMALFTELDA